MSCAHNLDCDAESLGRKGVLYPENPGPGQVQVALFRLFDTPERRDLLNCDLKILVDAINAGLSGTLAISSITTVSAGVQQHSDGAGVPTVTTLDNLYSANGTLTANRTVTGNAKSLVFTGINLFSVGSSSYTITSSGGVSVSGTSITLVPSDAIYIGTTPALANTVTDILVWDSGDSAVKRRDSATLGGAVSTIYSANADLAGNRTLTGATNAYSLTLSQLKSFTVSALDGVSLTSTSGTSNVTLSSGLDVILTPAAGRFVVLNNLATNNANTSILTVNASKQIQIRDYSTLIPAVTNIYNTDGSLTANRVVTGNAKSLSISGLSAFTVGTTGAISITASSNLTGSVTIGAGTDIILNPGSGFSVVAHNIGSDNTTANNTVLTIYPSGGSVDVVKKRTISSILAEATTLYSADGSLAGNRVVNAAGNTLTFSNLAATTITSTSTVSISGTTQTLTGSTSIVLTTPLLRLTTAPATTISNTKLLTRNATTGDIELLDSTLIAGGTTIYSGDSTLAANRTVSGGGTRSLTFNGLTSYAVTAVNSYTTTIGSGASGASTGTFTVANVNNNATFIVGSQTTGTGIASSQLAAFGVGTGDATVLVAGNASGGDSDVTISSVSSTGVGTISIVADDSITNTVGTTVVTIDADISLDTAGDVLLVQTPPTNNSNDNLVVWNATSKALEIRDATTIAGGGSTNIYNSNGSLDSNRAITGAGFSLSATGLSSFTVSASSGVTLTSTGGAADISLSSGRDIILSALSAGASETNFVMRAAGGQLRIRTLAEVSASIPTIYNTNTNLGADRTVSGNTGTQSLTFASLKSFNVSATSTAASQGISISSAGPAGITITNSNTGADASISSGRDILLSVNTARAVKLVTAPNDGSADTNLLTRSSDGSIKQRTVTSITSTITTLYSGDASLAGNRAVSGGTTASLTFNNLTAFTASCAGTLSLTTTGASADITLTPTGNVNLSTVAGKFVVITNMTADNAVANVVGINGSSQLVSRTVASIQSGVNTIYNANASLSGARTVTGAGNALTFTGIGAFTVSGTSISLTSSGATTLSNTGVITLTSSSATVPSILIEAAGSNIHLKQAAANNLKLTPQPSTDNTLANLLGYDTSGNLVKIRTVASLPGGFITAISDTPTVDLTVASGTLSAVAMPSINVTYTGASAITAYAGPSGFTTIVGSETQFYIDIDSDLTGAFDFQTTLATYVPTLNIPTAYLTFNNIGSVSLSFTDHNSYTHSIPPNSKITLQKSGSTWYLS